MEYANGGLIPPAEDNDDVMVWLLGREPWLYLTADEVKARGVNLIKAFNDAVPEADG